MPFPPSPASPNTVSHVEMTRVPDKGVSTAVGFPVHLDPSCRNRRTAWVGQFFESSVIGSTTHYEARLGCATEARRQGCNPSRRIHWVVQSRHSEIRGGQQIRNPAKRYLQHNPARSACPSSHASLLSPRLHLLKRHRCARLGHPVQRVHQHCIAVARAQKVFNGHDVPANVACFTFPPLVSRAKRVCRDRGSPCLNQGHPKLAARPRAGNRSLLRHIPSPASDTVPVPVLSSDSFSGGLDTLRGSCHATRRGLRHDTGTRTSIA